MHRPRWWWPKRSVHAERKLGLVTGVFYLWVALAIERANSVTTGSLNLPHLWPILIGAAGVGALLQGWGHSKTSWAVTTGLLVTSMCGRAIDLVVNLSQFTARGAVLACQA